jgi:WD40 repeat protein/predicted Ser/Thr protein kinase
VSADTHARLTAVFIEAIGLSPDDRAGLIERLRATDRGLADELVALLAADERADAALAADTSVIRRGAPVAGPLSIPGYRILEVLGEGAMGTVYAAEQRAPRRLVAIKVLHTRARSAVARFQTEAAIMARLDHPGIARVLEAGEAHGHPFLVMEYIDGETLERHARSLTREQRLGLVVAICDAVHHAHVKGVIHRDLKPSNVMVRTDGRIAVLDFGIARLASEAGPTPRDTRTGELIGTPIYMSPEQAQLHPDKVDARSDVYTLGVILYELLCDQLPYEVRGLPLPRVTSAICDDEPIALGRRDPALRGDLEAITACALRKDPRERYPSAEALAADIRRHLQRLPVSVRRPGAIERIARAVRRRPRAAVAAAAVVVAATCAIAVAWRWSHAPPSNAVILRQARAALASDPTEAVGWLAMLAPRTGDADAAWLIADEALGRGVAHDVGRFHTGEVRWIEAFPGSDSFVTGGFDGRVALWDPPDYRPRRVFQLEHGRVLLARPSPDGARIAVSGDDGALHVISRDGGAVVNLEGLTGKVERLTWSRGGWLATGDDKGNVWIWPYGRAPGKHLQASTAVIGTVEFSAKGDSLVAGDKAGTVWLWDLTADTMRTTRVDAAVIDSWTDGQRVVAVDVAGTVHTWHVEGHALVVDRTVITGLPPKRGVFSGDGAFVVLGGVGGSATRVEGTAIETIATHHVQVRYIAISADGHQIATASEDGELQVVDRATGRRWTLRGHRERIRHVEFARGVVLASDGAGEVRRWDISAMPPSVLYAHGAPIDHMVASADGRYIASVDTEQDVARWTVVDGGHAVLGHSDGRVTAIGIANDTVVTGTTNGSVTWWRDKPIRHTVNGAVRSIALGRDRIAVATAAGPIAMFTLAGEPRGEIADSTGGTEAIAFDPDGSHLVSGGRDRTIRVWRRDGDELVPAAALVGATGEIHVVMFSPRGDRLFIGGDDGVVLGWSAVRGELDPATRVTLAMHTGAITALAVSSDGALLASAGRDDSVVRVVLATGASQSFALGSAATVLAFDPAGAIHAITRTGGLLEQTSRGIATMLDRGVKTGAPIASDRLAFAIDGGGIVVARLGSRGLDELAATIAGATRYTR